MNKYDKIKDYVLTGELKIDIIKMSKNNQKAPAPPGAFSSLFL